MRSRISQSIPTNANNYCLHKITGERIGKPEQNAAIECVHEYKRMSERMSPGLFLPRGHLLFVHGSNTLLLVAFRKKNLGADTSLLAKSKINKKQNKSTKISTKTMPDLLTSG